MNKRRKEAKLAKDRLSQGAALVCLLVLGAMTTERDELRNRVALLDPNNTDSDLAGQLLRDDLNVVHPDELVMPIN